MAVAELLRTQTKEREGLAYAASMSDEQLHNSRIGENYAKLINSHSIDEVLNSNITVQPILVEPTVSEPQMIAPAYQAVPQAPVFEPTFAQSARVNSELFRADSVYNQSIVKPVEQVATAVIDEQVEEEDEDLRPTPTTIQYKSISAKAETSEGEIANTSHKTHLNISKKDKIVIAVVASIIIALFVLIIVNSAIISTIGSEISTLESELSTIRTTYSSVSGRLSEYQANLTQIVNEYAQSNGMVIG